MLNNLSDRARNVLGNIGDNARDFIDNVSEKTQNSSLSRILSDKLQDRKSLLTTSGGDEEAAETNVNPSSTFGSDWASELSLSRTQRLVGFAMCFVAGAMMLFLSILMLPTSALRPAKFALSFTLGNILVLCSTAFLIGPYRQLQYMFRPVRLLATCVYLISLFMAIFFSVAKVKLRYPLVVLSIIVEIGALLWYCASYIPFGQATISRLVGRLVEW
ncbi:Vesicle transport protein SFT2A [Galdieria sulphuraria]|nr:Vesicle transport protein SFT2A [Galdieria sulphuraria]